MNKRGSKRRGKQADIENGSEDFALQSETQEINMQEVRDDSPAVPPEQESAVVASGAATVDNEAGDTAPDDEKLSDKALDDMSDLLEVVPVFPNKQKAEPISAGMMLRQAREAAGLTVDSVAVALKLAPRQIAALENDLYEELPVLTFVRGFVRNYARLLNIDSDAVLAALPPERHAEISPAAISVKRPLSAMPSLPSDGDFPRAQRKIWRWLIALVILGLFFLLLFFKPQIELWLQSLQEPQEAAAEQEKLIIAPPIHDQDATQTLPQPTVILLGETVPEIMSSGNAPDATPASDDAELVFIFDGDSWVEVRDADGKALYMELARSGTQKTLLGKPPLSLVLGKAPAIRLTFRGQPVDLKAYNGDKVVHMILE
ncbi:MAG: DUF4115 domain-containing protein [Burkholderiales bacterium]|nr:DUF4115 domain-containing protein [Burkholderiales bacterium]